MKKFILLWLGFLSLAFGAEKLDKIVIAGPFSSISHPLFRLIEAGALNDVATKVEFRLWQNPDELRALLLKKEVQFVALPTNVAANLYNKKEPIRLLNVPIWGILEIVSRDANLKHIEDFKGKEIIVPFRADMPDIVLQALIKQAGLDPKKDFTLRYVPTPPDAMQMLILRRADNVLLAEPATSMAMRKTGSFPVSIIAPELHRSLNLQEEWGRLFKTEPKIPQAALSIVGEVDANVIKRFNEEYEKALLWYQAHPKEAGVMVEKELKTFKAEAISDSIAHTKFDLKSAEQSREALEHFFEILMQIEPKLIGSKIPDEGFYYR
ncbi:ABC transporter substrate-binding protein [Sulfurospirillum sp. hDNRA2]|uniref:ABC transporter substrate-binding protein n=1 Tax=Sulfurospirillum sp. hDNRA2 TaxID=3237298 RepID=UPI0020B86CD9|nr:MqnA/MqnD/SBP family protein [Sulfurospirillum sp. DNRA8]MCP3652725.1 ABC transporter substrate-binding protein [Sulfurospirillum sp. DNRA8]MCR1811577.1 ABC transporter substrate-binding protein [Sulfurospirillum sp. DNRA8]